jgi:signal transduction histidine kinase
VQPGQGGGMNSVERMRVAVKVGHAHFNFTYHTLSGQTIPVDSTVVRIDRGDSYQLIEYARDLRESIENKRKIREANERNITLDFERKAARAARKAAKDASWAKSDFLAKMSDEIRRPMNSIIGMSDLMRTDNLDKAQMSCLANIQRMSHFLLEIVNDVLDFLEIETEKMKLMPVHYSIGALFENICASTRMAIEKKELKFDHSISDKIPDILFGDEVRVRQIIVNLLSNAEKYTREGGVEIQLTRVKHLKHDCLSISVKDTGIGIEENDINYLFDMFAQFDSDEKHGIHGAGLGLPIVKQLVDMMNGEISVQSECGKGSTFTVYFPLIEGDPALVKHVGRGASAAV